MASKVVLGHGMGLLTDIVVGIIGAYGGGLLATYMGVNLAISGDPVVSEIIVGFVGAVILLAALRVIGSATRGGRAPLPR